MAEKEQILEEIEAEIKKAKGETEEFEIELVDDPVQEAKEEAKDVSEEKEDDYGPKVQKRIQKLVGQRREAEIQARQIQEQNAQPSISRAAIAACSADSAARQRSFASSCSNASASPKRPVETPTSLALLNIRQTRK